LSTLERIAPMHGEVTEWRHDLHANPELLYDVHRTAAFVAEKLRGFGCDETITGIGKTGVVGIIKGRTDSSGRTIGLRADMDALPMQEETGLLYASKVPGRMHACGHDGHTAMLLGAAQYLAATRNFNGTAIVVFQPAEEGGAGAKAMCDDGLMKKFGIQEIYAMHADPGLPIGQFSTATGPLGAAADGFHIRIEGKGTHAADPNMGVDPIVGRQRHPGAANHCFTQSPSHEERRRLRWRHPWRQLRQYHSADRRNGRHDTILRP
jgi:hippurate hydrolase